MVNVSEGFRNLFAYATFGCLAVAGGAMWEAHNELNAQKAEAVAAIQDLALAIQDGKLRLTELNLTNQLAQAGTFPPALPPADPTQQSTRDLQDRLAASLESQKHAQANFSKGHYWEVDDDVRRGFASLHLDVAVPDIDKIVLDSLFGVDMPTKSKTLGILAGISAGGTVLLGFDADGQGGRLRRAAEAVIRKIRGP